MNSFEDLRYRPTAMVARAVIYHCGVRNSNLGASKTLSVVNRLGVFRDFLEISPF